MAKKKDDNLGLAAGIGAVAAIAGAYFMYGSKKAAKNRKAVKSWLFKAKADVLEKLEDAQDMTKRDYEKLVDVVGAAYKDVKDVSKTELADFKREMKGHWDEIEKATAPKKKAVKKAAKKAVKKATTATKKVTKAPAKKSPAKKVAKKAPVKK